MYSSNSWPRQAQWREALNSLTPRKLGMGNYPVSSKTSFWRICSQNSGYSNIVRIFLKFESKNFIKLSCFNPARQARRLRALCVLYPGYQHLGPFSRIVGELTNSYWDLFFHFLKQRRKDHVELVYGTHIRAKHQRLMLQKQREEDRLRVAARLAEVERLQRRNTPGYDSAGNPTAQFIRELGRAQASARYQPTHEAGRHRIHYGGGGGGPRCRHCHRGDYSMRSAGDPMLCTTCLGFYYQGHLRYTGPFVPSRREQQRQRASGRR